MKTNISVHFEAVISVSSWGIHTKPNVEILNIVKAEKAWPFICWRSSNSFLSLFLRFVGIAQKSVLLQSRKANFFKGKFQRCQKSFFFNSQRLNSGVCLWPHSLHCARLGMLCKTIPTLSIKRHENVLK